MEQMILYLTLVLLILYYYLQSRYYDLEICRFINADLPKYARLQKNHIAGVNLFAYCSNDAVNNIDPKGTIKFNLDRIVGITSILMAIYSAISLIVAVSVKNIPIFKFIDVCVMVASIAINTYSYVKAIKQVKKNYKKIALNIEN